MSTWKEFVTASMLGTEKGGALPTLPAALEGALGPATNLDREAQFLTRAGIFALWRRVGWNPAKDAATLPLPAPGEATPLIGPMSIVHLRAMLGGHCADVLPEWLGETVRRQLCLPPEWLPALLDWARQNRTRRPLVMAAGGSRVRWLAAQNPEWNFADDDAPEHWETGNREQRVGILRAWRASDPAHAREQLETVWRTEPADSRAALLGVLGDGLSDADVPFLERALDDRSKEVRQQAVELLTRLPGSPFVARMMARAEGLLVYKRGGLLSHAALEVNLPSDPDPAGTRDGLDPKAFGDQVFGEKATLLIQILAAVPLRHWTDSFQQTPEALLQAARKHEFSGALHGGWVRAAMRQADPVWAAALLDAPMQSGDMVRPHAHTLCLVLPEETRAARLLTQLREGVVTSIYDHEPWHRFTSQLYSFAGHYPEVLARELLTALQRLAAKEQTPSWHVWHAARNLMLQIPPALLPEAIEGWPNGKSYLDLLVELLAFRRDVLAALAQP